MLNCARRNNLTIIDVVSMQGQGGYGELRFSNRKPGSQKPLTFEMSDKQLKQCDSECCRLIAVSNIGLFLSDSFAATSFEINWESR